MRTTPKVQDLTAIPCVRTELQPRLAWCMTGLTMGVYDSEERKWSKEEKVLLMTHLRELLICEGAETASAKWRALNTFTKMLREGSAVARTLLLQALLDIHQTKPLRVNMKEPLKLEPFFEQGA